MKWKLLLIVIGVIIAIVIFRENLSPKNNFPIIERDFSQKVSITPQPLNEQQIAKMAKELANSLPKTESKKKIIVSQAKKNNTKLTDLGGFLNVNLPDNWTIIYRGNPDFIVTGYFFHPKNNPKQASALFLFLIEWRTGKIFGATTNYTDSTITTMCEDLIENLGNRQLSDVKVKVINKLQDAQDLFTALILEKITTEAKPTGMTLLANNIYEELEEKLSDKQPPQTVEADATLIIAEDSNRLILELSKLLRDYETLAIKTNYTDDKITIACQNLIENLKKKPQTLKTIERLHVAVIHKQSDAQFSTKTALTLEEMVKAKPRIRLLGRNYTESYHALLRKAIGGGDLSENAKKHLRTTAVLSIEEDSGKFSLQLIRFQEPDTLELLASSVSDPRPFPEPRPFKIIFKADPQAKVYYVENQREIFIGRTMRALIPQDIEDLGIQEGTKFILKRNGNTKQYIHPDDGEREDDDDMIYYTYKWY